MIFSLCDYLYTCDFICNNNATLLLETLIEIYIEYYKINNIEINNLINNCITNIKNNNKHIYLCDDRMLFNTLSNSIIFLPFCDGALLKFLNQLDDS